MKCFAVWFCEYLGFVVEMGWCVHDILEAMRKLRLGFAGVRVVC